MQFHYFPWVNGICKPALCLSPLCLWKSHFFSCISERGLDQKALMILLFTSAVQVETVEAILTGALWYNWATKSNKRLWRILLSLIPFACYYKGRSWSFYLRSMLSSVDHLIIFWHIWKYCFILRPLRLFIGFSTTALSVLTLAYVPVSNSPRELY